MPRVTNEIDSFVREILETRGSSGNGASRSAQKGASTAAAVAQRDYDKGLSAHFSPRELRGVLKELSKTLPDLNRAKMRGFSPEQQLERWTTQLSLTETQKPKVKELLESGAKKRQEYRSLAQDERREKMRAVMEDQTKKMKEILTPDQFEKYQKLMERGRQRRGGPAAAQPSDTPKKAE